ncbi:MAG: ribosome maturation factor RimM [Pseudomonadota bacterium]|nr:MAG: 16S rRNA processing protein RimM [Pseudomonadota bacterium]
MIRVGRVARPHGVRGAVAVTLDNPDSESLFGAEYVHLGPERRRHEVVGVSRGRKGQVILQLQGVERIEQAEKLRGFEVWLMEEQLPPLGEEEYWQRDLLGLEAVDEEGRSLGRVTEIVDTAEVAVLVVSRGGRERFVPFTREYVPEVRLSEGRVVVRPLEEAEE